MLTPTDKIWHNGRFIPWQSATIHVLSHVVSYGSSVFEGIRCYSTPSGPAVFRLREHVRRMLDSARIYRMDNIGFSADQLADAMLELVRVNKMESCYLRPIVMRGYGEIAAAMGAPTAVRAVGAANGLLDVTMNGYASDVERLWGAAIMSSFHAAWSAGVFIGAASGGALLVFGASWALCGAAALLEASACSVACTGRVLPSPGQPTPAAVLSARLERPATNRWRQQTSTSGPRPASDHAPRRSACGRPWSSSV